MPLDLTPLETLPPAVEKVAGEKAPAALKMMAARGLSPLGPGEQLIALYQLALVDDQAVKSSALKSAAELPDKILAGALGEALDPRVLDFFARRIWQRPKPIEGLLLNRALADETVRHLATLCGETELELIARNEERLLRYPAIIAALYMNPKTRMSTAQRALELAVRNHVRVDGIAAFEEAKIAIEQSGVLDPKEDPKFKHAAEVAVDANAALLLTPTDEDEAQKLLAEEAERAEAEAEGRVAPESAAEVEDKKERLSDLSPAAKIRMAQLGNAFTRAFLIRDTNKQVAMAAIRSPSVSDAEALHYAANRSLVDEVVRFIANRRQWVRLYGVKVALCNNPKCPLPVSMRFLPHLRPQDLKALSRSKGIPSALANAARQMLTSRGL